MNKDLYDKEFEIPPHILSGLRKAVAKYSNQSVENTKRAKELSETGKATYQQLKRIKNWFDSKTNSTSPDFHVLGGFTFESWVNDTLKSNRESVRLPKEIRSVAMDNQFLDTHKKNNDPRKYSRPKYSHKQRIHRVSGISEEIQEINNWFKKLII